MKKIKLMIADDHGLFREGMRSLIEDFTDMELIGEAENGQELITKIKMQKPDVVLLDLNMPVIDGIEATKFIKANYPEIRIIVLTMHGDEKFIMSVIELGVNGYLLKNTDSAEVENTIRKVMDREYFFNEDISKIMHKGVLSKKVKPEFNFNLNLSTQELKVLKLICEEYTIQEIAEKVYLSPRTVEGYRQKLLKKTNSKNTAGMVKFAMRTGLIQ